MRHCSIAPYRYLGQEPPNSAKGMYYQTDDIDIDEQAATVPVNYNGNLNGYTVSVSCGFRF